ncbi:unnamed protein product [Closterium sp. NIES-64]|nr:unnamed protein product [Closterium sp. NIES-64]
MRLQSTAAINAVTDALYFSFTSVVALVTFATFTCLGGHLTASSVFYVLTLLELPRYTMGWKVAHGIQNIAEASVSFKRLSHFLQTKPHGATHKGAPSQNGYAALLPEARHYALEAMFESTQGANSQNGSALLPEERRYASDTQTTTTKPLKSTATALTAPSLQSPPSLELASLPCHSLSSYSAPTRLPSTPRAALVLEGASFSWGEAVGEARCEGEMEDEEKGEGLSRRRESHALQVASAGHVFDLSETPSTGCGCTDDGCRGYGTGYGTGYNRSSCSVAHVPSAFRMCFPQRFMGSHAAGLSPAAASASSSAADAAAVSAPVTAQGGQERQKEMGWRDDAPSGRVEGVSVRLGEAELLGVTGKNQAAIVRFSFPPSLATTQTGSGKSLLLLGILGEVPLSSGAMHRSVPSLAYASQQVCLPLASLSPFPVPLLIEGTVRDNILFGTPLDEALYTKVLQCIPRNVYPDSVSPLNVFQCPPLPSIFPVDPLLLAALSPPASLIPSPLKVLDACALHSDLALWPCGDASLVEEGGGNLSGGQRARVSLARAAYAALHCKMTAESAKPFSLSQNPLAVILILILPPSSPSVFVLPSSLTPIPSCDRVLLLDDDTAAACDSTDDCPLIGSKVVVEKAEAARGRGVDACRERECVSHGGQLAEGLICESGEAAAAAASAAAELRGGEEGVLEASGSTEGDEQGLLDVEGWQHGAIPMSVFWGYARQMGVLPLLLIAALFLAAHVSNCLASWFLGVWTDTPHTIHHPLLTLTAIALSCVALSLLASLLFHRAALRASSCLHSRMLASVLASPLAFFHRNPTGRVLNRFSEDLGVTDDVLPEMLLGLVNVSGSMVGMG